MKDYSCELGAACGPEAAAGRELAAVRKRRCVAEEAQVAGEHDDGRREPFRPMGLPAPLPLVMPL